MLKINLKIILLIHKDILYIKNLVQDYHFFNIILTLIKVAMPNLIHKAYFQLLAIQLMLLFH